MAPQEQPAAEELENSMPVSVRTIVPYGGDIVVSGISGRYPESDNVGELSHNLFNKINMLTVDNRRWEPGYLGTPLVMGKLKNIDSFDSEFFGVHSRSANTMDPMLRIMLEVVYEAVVDAGESLESLRGSRTGVYIGVSSGEFEMSLLKNYTDNDAYVVQGGHHSMFANWVSFFLDLRGPSCAYNTACSSGLVAMEAAERHMRQGVIDCAIVGACQIMYCPHTSKVFRTMSFVSDTACQSFDVGGDGFARSEIVSAIVMKKAEDAKRVYSTMMATMTNNDGFQRNGILNPNSAAQELLLKDFYLNTNIDPAKLKYFECHGTGTPAGDPNETKAICNAVCSNRTDPLPIGSVKSNLGHGETASGLAGIAKCMIIMHSRAIPPNLHFNTPNPNIPGLFDGTLKVVTETTPFDGGLVAINSFGLGGTNAHAVFRSFDKKSEAHPASDKPRLFTYCARTEEGLRHVLEEAHRNASNVEFQALCQESANTKPKHMPYRGATILNSQEEFTEIQRCSSKPREVWFIYSGMGSQWLGMGRSLMALDVFRQSIEDISGILRPFNVDILGYLKAQSEESTKAIMAPIVCINAIQLALTDLLKAMGIVPDGLVGHSLGEVGCAYADGCLTRREAVLSAYWRAQIVLDGKVAPGKMAAVELTWEDAKRLCPPGVVAACHNSYDSVTISGGAQEMIKFMAELTSQGVVVKEVNSSNISYHSHFMEKLSMNLKHALEKEIVPKPRSKKWISTSIPEERWDEPVAQTAGASYHVNNLVSPVLFYEGLQKVPSNAITIELAPSGLLQSVIKKSLGPECINVALQKRKHPNNLEVFFSAIGKCYAHGVAMDPLGLYPAVEFPVSIDTPMLSNMISQTWDHSAKWRCPVPDEYELSPGASSDTVFEFDFSDDSPDLYLLDHVVDGRILFPGTGTLVLAWKTLAKLKGVEFDQLAVQLSNVQIHQAVFLNPSGKTSVSVSVMPITGEFQVRGNETLLSSGVITSSDGPILETDQHTKKASVLDGKPITEVVTVEEVYRELRLRGYEYGPYFQGIQRASIDAQHTDMKWDGRWISYLDTVLQMSLLCRPGTHQSLPVLMESVIIDPRVHPPPPNPETTDPLPIIPGHWDPVLDTVAAGGVEIRGSHTIRSARRLTHDPPTVEVYTFAPYIDPSQSEFSAPVVTPQLRAYADACFEYSRQGIRRMLEEDKNDVLPQKTSLREALDMANKIATTPETASNFSSAKATLETLAKSQNGHGLPNHGVYELLDMVFNEPMDGDIKETLIRKLHDRRAFMWDDPIVKVLESEHIMKYVLDTVADNVNPMVVDILEVGAGRSALYRQAIPKALEYLSVKDFRYTVADKIFIEDAVNYPVKILQFDPTDPANFPAAQDESYHLIILKWQFHLQDDLDEAIEGFTRMLKPGGFLLVVENVVSLPTIFPIQWINLMSDHQKGGPEGERLLGSFYSDAQWSAFFKRHGFEQIIHRHDGIAASMFLLRKTFMLTTPPIIINVDDPECRWLEEVQARVSELPDLPDDARLWLVATKEINGLLGFFRCLSWDIGVDKCRCVHILDTKPGAKVPQITADSPAFKEVQKKDMVYNVYKDGKWGTYRGFLTPEAARQRERPSECVFADWLTAGDISSLRWFDSPLKTGHHNGMLANNSGRQMVTEPCSVYYAGVDLRDVVLADGTVKRDILPEETFFKEGVLGIEFSGRNSFGKRVMGLCSPPALASSVQCPVSSLWRVPDHWTLDEAATVPLAYAKAYHSLVIVAGLQKGKKVFIHAGTSPVGQAAIAVALSYNCEVFILTSNRDETALLTSIYPQLKDVNFCSSEECSFERHIRKETKGQGVDVVLNTLRGKALKASRRLLAKQGVFLDIAYQVEDQAQAAFYMREQTDLRFQLDALLESQGPEWTRLYGLIQAGIQDGVVKPLRRASYGMDRLVDAFKAVKEQRKTDKVLIKIRDEEKRKLCQPTKQTFPAVHRTCFDPRKSHIVVGALGGMGMETVHWMVLRGAKKLILTSRHGITNGYQARKISYLRQLGADVEVFPMSVNNRESADKLFEHALRMGPVGSIFNIATALKDGEFHSMTYEDFIQPLEAKVTTTKLLDEISRAKPVRDTLDHFVMFSSIAVSHGHLGQFNYGLGNNVLEKICEKRKRDGLPATVPQWASIGDVGLVAAMGEDKVLTRKFQQRFFNVLSVLDYMMNCDDVINTSYVLVARTMKFSVNQESLVDQLLAAVGKILGVKNVSDLDGDKEFIDLGVDSLMSVEIKQALERDVDLVLSTKEIQRMTFNTLRATVEGF